MFTNTTYSPKIKIRKVRLWTVPDEIQMSLTYISCLSDHCQEKMVKSILQYLYEDVLHSPNLHQLFILIHVIWSANVTSWFMSLTHFLHCSSYGNSGALVMVPITMMSIVRWKCIFCLGHLYFTNTSWKINVHVIYFVNLLVVHFVKTYHTFITHTNTVHVLIWARPIFGGNKRKLWITIN